MDYSTPGFPVLHHFPQLTQTHVYWVGDAFQPSHSVVPFSSCLQYFPASGSFLMGWFFTLSGQSIRASASASVLPVNIQDWFPLGWAGWNIPWHVPLVSLIFLKRSLVFPKYQSFNISPYNEYSGLISFTSDWLDLLGVQGTLKSLLQHHSSKASILRLSAFFTVQLSHPYMTTGKTIALTGRTFVGKVMSLLLNMLSRLVITFLPRSKCLLIPWLWSPSAVILEPRKINLATVSTVSPSICHEVMV